MAGKKSTRGSPSGTRLSDPPLTVSGHFSAFTFTPTVLLEGALYHLDHTGLFPSSPCTGFFSFLTGCAPGLSGAIGGIPSAGCTGGVVLATYKGRLTAGWMLPQDFAALHLGLNFSYASAC